MTNFVGTMTPFPQIHHERISEVIREAKSTLREGGVKFNVGSFPYTLHHERMKSAIRHEGLRLTHAEIYALLSRWAEMRGNPDDYAWQLIGGALDGMGIREQELPEGILSGLKTVDFGRDFLQFARRELGAEG